MRIVREVDMFIEGDRRKIGRDFETKVFGVDKFGPNLGLKSSPDYLNFDDSLKQIIDSNWAMYAHSLEKGEPYCHNPIRPRMGLTHQIWAAVKNWLPKRVEGEVLPLNLYISVGRNSLDFYHGVDAFFWWNWARVTVDVSYRPKGLVGLKADLGFSSEDLQDPKLLQFGRKVASLLVQKNLEEKERMKCKVEQLVSELLRSGLG